MPIPIITAFLKAITSVSELGTKAILPDEARIRNSRIKEPLKMRHVNIKIKKLDLHSKMAPWEAEIKSFNLKQIGKRKTITQGELIKYVRQKIAAGAEIESIRKTDTEIQLDYIVKGFCLPTEIFYL